MDEFTNLTLLPSLSFTKITVPLFRSKLQTGNLCGIHAIRVEQ